jgi:hypothetical protein
LHFRCTPRSIHLVAKRKKLAIGYDGMAHHRIL